jgi:hypothetical protein
MGGQMETARAPCLAAEVGRPPEVTVRRVDFGYFVGYAADQLAWRAHADGHGQPLPAVPAWLDRVQRLDPRLVYFAHDRSVWTP